MSKYKKEKKQQNQKPTFMQLFANALVSVFADEKNAIVNIQELSSLVDIAYLKNFDESKGYYTLKRAINFNDLNLISRSELKSLLNWNDLAVLNAKEFNFINSSMLVNGIRTLLLFFLGLLVVGGTSLNFIVFNQLIDRSVAKGEELSVNELQYITDSSNEDNIEQEYFENLLSHLDSHAQCNQELTGSNVSDNYEYSYINGFKVISVCNLSE